MKDITLCLMALWYCPFASLSKVYHAIRAPTKKLPIPRKASSHSFADSRQDERWQALSTASLSVGQQPLPSLRSPDGSRNCSESRSRSSHSSCVSPPPSAQVVLSTLSFLSPAAWFHLGPPSRRRIVYKHRLGLDVATQPELALRSNLL
ncbi:hypothetical protein K402DRAFT_178631 [Aulographum hederae CBS 113979]|uniref:Secreted protein n=1 Tax=Aulographum hederae CBS 113979 TaxID=1176131 RepID=A0A6G1GQD3_9PEZI|nr:hypothetical protein K402DRAFT_178631 [Aulographum hederae CBS 113979]